MREIIPSLLWLGNAMDVCDLRSIHDLGISAIVDLALEEPVPQLTREIIYCRFPIIDGSGNTPELLSAAIEITASFIRKSVPAMVACSAGMSRSPAIVAAALALVHCESPDDSLKTMIAGNPHDLSPPLWTDVKNVYNGLTG